LDGAVISLKQVTKSFDDGASFAVRGVSFRVAEGETLALLGTSGCGKTTTLKMINRLIEPTSGIIEVGGRNILEQNPVELRRSIGYVFQGIGLFPHMTIAQNIGLVPKLLDRSTSERRSRAEELMDAFGLPVDRFAERYPDELSGGQQQRVGVARALAADPDILLMDEPFGALDAMTRDVFQQEMVNLKRRLGKTIIFVTHDIFEALTVGDRIAVMHDGQIEQLGTREEIITGEQTPVVRELFEKPKRQLAQFADLL
jgi:osmoprotectant transport system ATP-binding protein